MRRYIQKFKDAFLKGDLILLLLCVVTTAFGCLMIASATAASASGPLRYLLVQIGASVAGVLIYVWISSIDAEVFSEHRMFLVIGNAILLLMLIPFGINVNGNKSWIDFPFLPFNIQPAEICKITFILIMASVMASNQNRLSSIRSLGHMAWHLGVLFGLNMIISGDMGVSLIFAFIFAGMTFAGGVSLIWFLGAIGVVAIVSPIIWNYVLADYQKTRILVLFDPSLDPLGIDAMYQTVRAQRSLTGGGMTGQGLFNGTRTQTTGSLVAQHTDFIFAAIGEELGYVGCALVLLVLFLIIARCVWVGVRSPDFMRRLICFGAASALFFQVLINVGMVLGVMPVIGLTLPFISYGGSSIITLYAMLGLVSGVYAHPNATSHERYIRAPLVSYRGR